VTAARSLLALGAALLLATALFHGSSGGMVSGWLDGQRGEMLRALWYLPSLDWLVVAAIWGVAAARPSARYTPILLLTALMPLGAAAFVAGAVGVGFPGVWMLIGAGLAAAAGALRSRRLES
jgi:hypothetical protein